MTSDNPAGPSIARKSYCCAAPGFFRGCRRESGAGTPGCAAPLPGARPRTSPARRRPPGRHRHLVPSTRPPDARPASICRRPLLNSSTPQSLFLQLCRPRWPACLLTTMQTSFHASRLVCMPACLFACLSACLFASKHTSLPACMYACLLAQAIARRTLRWSGRQGRRTALAGSVAWLELPPQPAPLPRWGSGDLFGFGCGCTGLGRLAVQTRTG